MIPQQANCTWISKNKNLKRKRFRTLQLTKRNTWVKQIDRIVERREPNFEESKFRPLGNYTNIERIWSVEKNVKWKALIRYCLKLRGVWKAIDQNEINMWGLGKENLHSWRILTQAVEKWHFQSNCFLFESLRYSILS